MERNILIIKGTDDQETVAKILYKNGYTVLTLMRILAVQRITKLSEVLKNGCKENTAWSMSNDLP